EVIAEVLPCGRTLRIELLRIGKAAHIVVGAVEVEQDPDTLAELVAVPVEALARTSTDKRKEWIEPADFHYERLQHAVIAGANHLMPAGMRIQCHCGKYDVAPDSHNRTHDVDRFDGCLIFWQRQAVGPEVAGNHVERAVLWNGNAAITNLRYELRNISLRPPPPQKRNP